MSGPGHPPAAVARALGVVPRLAPDAALLLAGGVEAGPRQAGRGAGRGRPAARRGRHRRAGAAPDRAERPEAGGPGAGVDAIREAESTLKRQEADRRWQEIRAEALVPSQPAEERLAMIQDYLRDDPDSPHADEAVALAETIRQEMEARQSEQDREVVDVLARRRPTGRRRPGGPDRAGRGLPGRTAGEPARRGGPRPARRLDRPARPPLDFEEAAAFEESSPRQNFDEQIRRYRDYLVAHAEGGAFAEQAKRAIERIEQRRDLYLYRQAYDHWTAHPEDVAEVARRLRSYLAVEPRGPLRRRRRGVPRLVGPGPGDAELPGHARPGRGRPGPDASRSRAGGRTWGSRSGSTASSTGRRR